MFGQDDTSAQTDDITAINPTLNTTDASTPADDAAADTASPTAEPTVITPSTTPEPTTTVEPEATPEVTATPEVEEPATATPEAADAPADTTPDVADESPVAEETPSTSPDTSSADADDLLALKKQALGELTPLLDKLDQTPEEKFKTTMMMIQATDSASLVSVAHAAALEITDEKVRAQALLDIVNEINYFTQNTDKKED